MRVRTKQKAAIRTGPPPYGPGTRHDVVLAFSGAEAVAAGEAFLDALPEHEFAIPRQLVADATVLSVEHTALPDPRLVVEVQLLLLEET